MAVGSEAVVTTGSATMLMLRTLVAESEFASVTFTVKLLVPEPVGVPEIAPVPGVRVNPTGSVPDEMDHVYGSVPFVAARFAE